MTHVYWGGPEGGVRAVEAGSQGPVCVQEPCTRAAGWPSAPSHSPPHALLRHAQVSHYIHSGQFWNRSFGAALTTVPETLSRGGERSRPRPLGQPPLPPPRTPLQDPGRTQLDPWAGFCRRGIGPWWRTGGPGGLGSHPAEGGGRHPVLPGRPACVQSFPQGLNEVSPS